MTSTFHEKFQEITGGQSIAQISQRTGIDHGSISRYRNGTRLPRADRLRRIAEEYSVTIDELLGLTRDAA